MIHRIHSGYQRALPWLQSRTAEKIIGMVAVGCIWLMFYGWLVVL